MKRHTIPTVTQDDVMLVWVRVATAGLKAGEVGEVPRHVGEVIVDGGYGHEVSSLTDRRKVERDPWAGSDLAGYFGSGQ